MKKDTIDSIISALQQTASDVDRIELQFKLTNTVKLIDEIELTDAIAKDIAQVNVYFKEYRNAKHKRIHFTATTCAVNNVYKSALRFNEILTADSFKLKSNYFQFNYTVDMLDTIAYALTYAHFSYLEKCKALTEANVLVFDIADLQQTATASQQTASNSATA